MTTAQDWEMCLNQDVTQCGSSGQCAYDLGLDLVPRDAEHCAPFFLTKNVTEILACVGAKEESTCNSFYGSSNRCMWRRGKVVANNTYYGENQNKELFKTNLCHPPTIDNWNQTAPHCLQSDTEATCDPSRCVWSTMQMFIPRFEMMNRTEVCLPAEASQYASAYETCAANNNSQTCGTGCKMYDLTQYEMPQQCTPPTNYQPSAYCPNQ